MWSESQGTRRIGSSTAAMDRLTEREPQTSPIGLRVACYWDVAPIDEARWIAMRSPFLEGTEAQKQEQNIAAPLRAGAGSSPRGRG